MMAKPNMRTSAQQFEIMLEFIQNNPSMLRMNSPSSKDKNKDLWLKLAATLNAEESGPSKEVEKWKKTFRDWKLYVRAKASRIQIYKKSGGYSTQLEKLTWMEEKLIRLIGHKATDDDSPYPEPTVTHDDIVIAGPSGTNRNNQNSDSESVSSEMDTADTIADKEKLFDSFCNCNNSRQRNAVTIAIIEKLLAEKKDQNLQLRIAIAEEKKAEALMRMADAVERIAATAETVLESL